MNREEAIARIKDHMFVHKIYEERAVKITEAINMAISALEQPEIIRRGECKHSEHWYRDKARCFLWHEEGIDVFEDGYCNYAERKEGEAE